MTNDLECPNCGTLNSPDLSNCKMCNLSTSVFETVAKKKGKKQITCSNCKHENPSMLSVCEECGERIERAIDQITETKEKKEMTRTQQILLLIGVILLLPLVIIGFVLYFIINAITGISKGRMALDEVGVDAYAELEKGSRKR